MSTRDLSISRCVFSFFFWGSSPNSLLLEFYLRKIELATLTGRALNSVAGLCVQSLSSSCPLWLGSVAGLCVQALSSSCPLWLGSVAGLCVQALSSSCPLWRGSVSRPCPPLGRAPELCGWALCPGDVLCGWALSSSCPPLVLVLAAPLNSVAGLCGPVCWRGVWPKNSDVNADKNSLVKQFALGVKVGRTKKSIFDHLWSKRTVSKLFGGYACNIACFDVAHPLDNAPSSSDLFSPGAFAAIVGPDARVEAWGAPGSGGCCAEVQERCGTAGWVRAESQQNSSCRLLTKVFLLSRTVLHLQSWGFVW